EEMPSVQTRLVVSYGLTTLLEGVSRAAVVSCPQDIAEFFSLYFQGLDAFHRGWPWCWTLDFIPMAAAAHVLPSCAACLADTASQGAEEPSGPWDTELPRERGQRDKCTDTQEDQLLEEPDTHCSSELTQHPSSTSSFGGSTAPPASEGALTPVGAALAYIPAEPAALAQHLLGNSSSFCSRVATSVQTLPSASQASDDELTPVECGSEDASAVSHPSLRDVATSVQTLP
ncbi:CABYR protein, partial [Ramphastos sulfuratus]|nr:CABYR protein [Ramphastos sulfuratus]